MKHLIQKSIVPLWCCVAVLSCRGIAMSAESATQTWAVDETRRLLREQDDIPWYNPETDTIRPVEVTPLRDDAHRHSSWTTTPTRRKKKTLQFSWLRMFWEIMQWVMRAVMVLLLLGLLALLVRTVLRMERTSNGDTVNEEGPTAISRFDRLENLPVAVDKIDGNLLDLARRHREAGDYGQAVVYLFAHMLIEMDNHHVIRLMRGKTNRQYMTEIGWQSPLCRLLRPTMIAFEDSFFGQHEISRARLDACWNTLEGFHGQLEHLD